MILLDIEFSDREHDQIQIELNSSQDSHGLRRRNNMGREAEVDQNSSYDYD